MNNVFCVSSYEYRASMAMQQYYYVQGLNLMHSYKIRALDAMYNF